MQNQNWYIIDLNYNSHGDFKEDPAESLCGCCNSYDDFDYITMSKLNKLAQKRFSENNNILQSRLAEIISLMLTKSYIRPL